MKFPSLSIRTRALLISLMLLAIPWLGYKYVREMEKILRQGQEKTLVGTARAVATALHDRPNLFNSQSNFSSAIREDRDLYVRALNSSIEVDGKTDDWIKQPIEAYKYAGRNLLESRGDYSQASLSFNHRIGKYGKYLYALFEVTDNRLIYRDEKTLSPTQNDHLQIAIVAEDGSFNRYVLPASKVGLVNAYLTVTESEIVQVVREEPSIQGVFAKTDKGYTLEIRMPLNMLGPKLGFAITDVDDTEAREVKNVIGTSNVRTVTELGVVLTLSPEIEQIIKGLSRTTSRIWVVDNRRRVLAYAGSLIGERKDEMPNEEVKSGLWKTISKNFIEPLYSQILRPPSEDFQDDLSNASRLEGKEIESALSGIPLTQWRHTPDDKAVILSAAHPIWVDDKVMGAVVAEETTNAIVTLRNQALGKLFNVTLIVFLLGTLTLFIFASRLSIRIRKLRNEAEHAIDPQGRVKGIISGSNASDEIGDLSKSFSTILGRLGQYTSYLENMGSRLSHEMRTPIAVVRSSLDNLRMQALPEEAKIYMERAHEGLTRLSTILTRMSEATRLEQTLQHAEHENFDANKVLSGCIEGYKTAYPHNQFILQLPDRSIWLNGSPDLFAQMLDKLIANAIDFSNKEDPIAIRLNHEDSYAILRVINAGPLLPEDMKGQLFESMVSIRAHKTDNEPHLGLGLYIARLIAEFHHGKITAANREDIEGVVIMIKFVLSDVLSLREKEFL